jgi:hypothetical protein
MIDTQEIEREIKASIKSKVDDLIKEVDIMRIVSRTVDLVIAERVSTMINNQLLNLVQKGKLEKELDSKYQDKLNSLLEQEIKQRAANAVARIDMPSEVGKQIAECVSNKLKIASLPEKFINHKNINWDGFQLTAAALTDGVIENFISSGIQDVASQIELTVADTVVVIENTLVVKNAEVKENFVADDIAVNNITITGQLNMNEQINKQFVSLMKDVFHKEFINQQIDIVVKPILANGKEVLTENTLGSNIVNSNLRKLGRLTELNVAGIAQFNDTLIVTNSGKIGINTEEPEGALTIWDDDSDLTIRRYKKKNMYVGTMRDTDLSFGVNGDVKLALRKDGTVAMNHIELNGLKVSVSNSIPSSNGSPGEIVLISNAGEDEPWAYRCIGGDRWKAIR